MLDMESKTNVSESVIFYCDLEEVMYSTFYRDRRKENLILHRLFLREEGKTDQQTSVSGDCTPSNMFNNFKAYIFIAFIIHWFKIMATFYCILGYQRNNEVFEVPAIEMLLAFTYGWQRQ